MDINVTFFEANGRLVRKVSIQGQTFYEQFDWDGWYGYHPSVFSEINVERAILLAIREMRVVQPQYSSPDRAKIRLYQFDLYHLDRKLR
jgi:hypothetical protein